MTSPSPRYQHGLTLVELLIALTLFALLSVMLFGGLRFGTRASEAGLARNERSAQLAAAAGFLRSQLADAQPLQKSEGGEGSIAFEGEHDSVEFVTLPPAHLAVGGWHTLHLGLEPRGSDAALVMRWRVIVTGKDGPQASEPGRAVLIEHLAGMELGYFGALSDETTPQWHDQWRGAAQLPYLMRLRLTFADGHSVPEMIFALRPAGTPDWPQ